MHSYALHLGGVHPVTDRRSHILRIAEHICGGNEEGNSPGTYLTFSMRLTPASSYFSDSGGDAFFCPLPG